MQEYKILQSDSTHGLEMLVKEAINAGEMQLYGDASEFGGRKCQVVVKGIASPGTPSLPGGNDTPEAVLLRIATAEMKAAQAALTASEAKGAAEVASANLATIALEVSRKADLVSGKVPYDQLPEFPVGRKVNVPDKAARLALTNYTDLTIAYQSDTGDAWGLDANADAAVEANWSRLGNAQAVGVQSFNGRTGNIGPQQGDYITSMIPEALGKRYVTEAQITAWTAKAGPAEITAAINQALAGGDLPFETKQHATDTYLTKGAAGAANGVASLDASSMVPVLQIKRNVAGGFAQLNADSKLNNNLLKYNEPLGVAPLDSNGRVPADNLPAPKARQWRDVKASRTIGQWTTNSSGNDMEVYLRTEQTTAASRYIQAVIRKNAADSNGLTFSSGATAATSNRRHTLNLTVPAGWQYIIVSDGGTTIAATQYWYEMS